VTFQDFFVEQLMGKMDIHKLASKLGGAGASYMASHLAALTTTPDYSQFWANWYMTAPQITNQPGFEKKVTLVLTAAWLVLDHFIWRIQMTAKDHVRYTDPKQPQEVTK
jgi:hypothetical protein